MFKQQSYLLQNKLITFSTKLFYLGTLLFGNELPTHGKLKYYIGGTTERSTILLKLTQYSSLEVTERVNLSLTLPVILKLPVRNLFFHKPQNNRLTESDTGYVVSDNLVKVHNTIFNANFSHHSDFMFFSPVSRLLSRRRYSPAQTKLQARAGRMY